MKVENVIEGLTVYQNTLAQGSEKLYREVNFAKKIVEKDANLQRCNMQSVINCIESAVKCGLSLNPVLNLCYLSNNADNACTLEISYLGFIKILKDSGSVKHIDAHIIYEDENFNEDTTTGLIHHEKKYAKSEADQRTRNMLGVYCIAILPDNTRIFSQVIPAWEIEKRRLSNKMEGKNSPWEMWKEDMYKKTGVRMWWKFLITGDVGEQLSTVLEIDNNNSGFDRMMNKPVKQKKSLSKTF